MTDGTLPIEQWITRSMWATLYLGILGSFVDFIAYFYVLQKPSVITVALIPLFTPIIALSLGAYLNNESIGVSMMFGAGLLILGVALYHFSWE